MHLIKDADLLSFNALAVPARAQALARLEHWYEVENLAETPEFAELPLLILGGGTNVVFRGDFPGLALRIENQGIQIVEEEADVVLVRVAAGEDWASFVRWAARRLLWGIENLAAIPGCVGAAPIQNIGAYGCEVGDVLDSVTAWDRSEDRWVTLDRDACGLGYRSSRFRDEDQGRFILTEIALRLRRHGEPNLSYPGVAQALPDAGGSARPTPLDLVQTITRIREAKLPDPRVIGNVGSFFKNPVVSREIAAKLLAEHPRMAHFSAGDRVKLAAAWLIEACGWKGHREGSVGVYEKHALVLVNRGGASGADVWRLAGRIQASVHDVFGINLEPEPTIV